jgi:hypothetical protein
VAITNVRKIGNPIRRTPLAVQPLHDSQATLATEPLLGSIYVRSSKFKVSAGRRVDRG